MEIYCHIDFSLPLGQCQRICHLKPGPLIGDTITFISIRAATTWSQFSAGVDRNKTTDYRHHKASQVIAAIDFFCFVLLLFIFLENSLMLKFSAIFWPVALVTFSLLFQFYFFSSRKTIKRSDNSFFFGVCSRYYFHGPLYKIDHKILVQELESEGADLLLLIFHSSKLGLPSRGRKVNNLLMLLCSLEFGIIEFHVNLWKC